MDEFSPEYLADKAKWDALKDELYLKTYGEHSKPVPLPPMWKPTEAEIEKRTAMSTKEALEEYRQTPEFKAAEVEREARKAEYARLSEIPIVLSPVRHGLVQKPGGVPFFVIKLLGYDEEKGADVQNLLPVEADQVKNFVLEQQEHVVSLEISSEDLEDAILWVSNTPIERWSMEQHVHRRQRNSVCFVFSFSEKETAALFKLIYG